MGDRGDVPGSSDPVSTEARRDGGSHCDDAGCEKIISIRKLSTSTFLSSVNSSGVCQCLRVTMFRLKNGSGTGLVLSRKRFSSISAHVSIRSKPNFRFQVLRFSCINNRRICPRRFVAARSATRVISPRRRIVASAFSDVLAKPRSLTVIFKNQIKNAVLVFT